MHYVYTYKGGLSYWSVNAMLIYTEESYLSVNAILIYTEEDYLSVNALRFTLKRAICQSMHHVLHLRGISVSQCIMFYT